MNETRGLPYRPEIDGIRAFAVAAVILYHAFPEVFRGGFLGVDIFFVISGYLITGILRKDAENGSVNLPRFYARRIRRIFPALAVVLCCSLCLGWAALLPDEYRTLGKHIAGGAFFVDNILLWREAGYFDAESAAKPLLHLWSLGIEEQYYLVFPLVVALFVRKPARLLKAILCIVLVSFICNLCMIDSHPVAVFFLPVTRIWELLVGALLACLWRGNQVGNRLLPATCIFLLGTSLVTTGFILADGGPWPGWRAGLPTLGTCCLIATAGGTPLGKFLFCNKLAVYCGKISYPLYLWHWPLLSLSSITGFRLVENSVINPLLLVGIAFAAASLTYHGIEKKIRFRKDRGTIGALLSVMLTIGLLGILVWLHNGFEGRCGSPTGQDYLNCAEVLETESRDRCLRIFPDWKELNDNICRTQDSLDKIDTAIIGDSHAGHLFAGLALANSGHSFAVFPASGAAPFTDVMSFTRQEKAFRKNGITLINRAYAVVLAHTNIKNVILAHRPFCSYVDLIDARVPSEIDRDTILENAMRRSFSLLVGAGKNVVVVLDNPRSPVHPRNCRPRPLDFLNTEKMCTFAKEEEEMTEAMARKWYRRILSKVLMDFPAVLVVDLSPLLCTDGLCHLEIGGDILYEDSGHLSPLGSRLVSKEILPALR